MQMNLFRGQIGFLSTKKSIVFINEGVFKFSFINQLRGIEETHAIFCSVRTLYL